MKRWARWMAAFAVTTFAWRVAAAVLVQGPSVQTATNGDVSIVWQTDVPTGGRVQFGTNVSKLDQRVNDEVTATHQVTLPRLRSGTAYFYTVGSARQSLATNSFFTPGLSPAPAASVKPAVKPASQPAPPARETWGHLASLADHFERHGADFRARSAEEYAWLAWEFLQRARSEGLPAKQDEDGTLRVFDRRSGAFAAYNRDGTTKTFFKPGSPDYFERQPGRHVKLKTLSFK